MAQVLEEKNGKTPAVAAAPPDGGWGWMVVIGAALINLVNQSMFANYGLIFGEHLKDLADGHATAITLVMALSVVVTNFTGLLVGPLLKKFSISTLNFFGIFCTGSGLIICSFSTQIWQICIGYGFVTGLGLGLLASGTFLAINEYFTTKKSTAVGISMAGTGIGQMTMPTLIGLLLKKYDFSGTTLILGFMSFTGIIGAMFFRPILCCKKTQANQLDNTSDESRSEKGVDKNEETTLLPNRKPKVTKGVLMKSQEAHLTESVVEVAGSQQFDSAENPQLTWPTKLARALGLPLLKDLTYVHIVIGLGFGYVGSVSFSTFFPMFLQDEVKFTMMQTTSCMTALSFSDVLGRITSPEVCRRMRLGNRGAFMLGCVLLGISRSCLVELTEFKYVLTAAFIVGYFRAITVINQNLVISEYIEKDKLPYAVGLNMVSKAILTLTIGQSLGYMKDLFSYGVCIHFLNILLAVVVFGFCIEKLVKALMRKKQRVQQVVSIEQL